MKALRTAGFILLALVALLAAAVSWLVGTNSGAQWAFGQADSMISAPLEAGEIEGSIAGGLRIKDLQYGDENSAVELQANRASVDIALAPLLTGELHINEFSARGLDVYLHETPAQTSQQPQQSAQPFDLQPPLDIVLEQATIQNATVRRQGETLVDVQTLEAAGRWTDAGVFIDTLDLDAQQGAVTLQGELHHDQAYTGQAQGEFRWQVGERTLAGSLQVDTTAQNVLAGALQLTRPTDATLTFELRAAQAWPWSFELMAEPFNPQAFGVGGALDSLAANLQGEGDQSGGRVTGRIVVNDEPVKLQPLEFSLAGEMVSVSADIAVDEAQLALELEASADQVRIEHLRVQQTPGELQLSGSVQLQPTLQWDLQASAESFNPGVFLPQWPGDLTFDLQTQGAYAQQQPRGELHLENLEGELRGRPVSGQGDLRLTRDSVIAGDLHLESGASEIDVSGRRDDRWDARVDLQIASLEDWLPQAEGSVRGDFSVEGDWPSLHVTGDATASDLEWGGLSLGSASADVNLRDLTAPRGSADVQFRDLQAANMTIERGAARFSGTPQDHRITLTAQGDPLSVELAVEGERQKHNGEVRWVETIKRLQVDPPDAPTLSLESPARLVIDDGTYELSQLCLTHELVELCAGGRLGQDGALQANYEISQLPLQWLSAAAPLPVDVAGALSGQGELRRTAEGKYFGNVGLQAPQIELTGPLTDAAQDLLELRNVRVQARATGEQLSASVRADLAEDGRLRGQVQIAQLGQARSPIDGELTATLPDLSALTVLTPYIAEVSGEVHASVGIGGALSSPTINGEVRATELSAELPALGLHLTEGVLRAESQPDGPIQLRGAVQSGPGRLQIEGTATLDGRVELSIEGERFLAVDIPGARVIAAPDLRVVRTAEALRLTGEVFIPTAKVELQELPPAARAETSSPDVVIVDESAPQEQEAQALPVYASIEVVLGEQVEVHGFGLQTQIDGRLKVNEAPGEPTTGTGDLRLEGSYEAFGRNLTVTEGSILYASTPIDNPALRIIAAREIGEITTGLTISGTAQAPEIDVFSDPSMDTANTLSYLVAGSPVGGVPNDQRDRDALQSAMTTLGLTAGGLAAAPLAERIGLDTVGVQESEVLDAAAFTVGRFLSPRLFLSYGVGLFEPGGVLTLRYQLSEEVALRAVRGADETRAGVEYRVEN